MTTVDMVDPAVDDAQITAFFAADPATIAWPYPMYERWREGTGVVRWQGGPATLITRHADVKAVMGGHTRSGRTPTGSASWPRATMRPAAGRAARGLLQGPRLREPLHEPHRTATEHAAAAPHRRRGRSPPGASRCCASRSRGTSTTWSTRCSRNAAAPDVKRDLANKLPVRVIVDLHRRAAVRPRHDLGVVGGDRRGCSASTRRRCARPTRPSTPSGSTSARSSQQVRDDRRGSGAGPAAARPPRQTRR